MTLASCPAVRSAVTLITSRHQMGWCWLLTQKVVLQLRQSAEDYGQLQNLSINKKGFAFTKVNWTC